MPDAKHTSGPHDRAAGCAAACEKKSARIDPIAAIALFPSDCDIAARAFTGLIDNKKMAKGYRACFAVVIAAAAARAVAAEEQYFVHALSAAHKRPAAWQRTKCGSPSVTPQPDLITQWGAAVTPNNVLQEYPRPNMVRGGEVPGPTAPSPGWINMNGLWEHQLGNGLSEAPPFGVQLNNTILVPFPLEACLSGAFAWPGKYAGVQDTSSIHAPARLL